MFPDAADAIQSAFTKIIVHTSVDTNGHGSGTGVTGACFRGHPTLGGIWKRGTSLLLCSPRDCLHIY